MAWLEHVRSLIERFPAAPVAIVVAVSGFVILQRDGLQGGASAVAYAEAIHHEIAPVVTGRITEIRVHVGQQVKSGEVIAVMDDRPLVAARERARAELAKRRAEVAAALLEQDARVTRGELALVKARAEEQGDRARLEEVSRQIARLDDLLERKMIPATDAESAHEKAHELSARIESYDRGRAVGGPASRADTHQNMVEARLEPYKRAVVVQEAAIVELERALEDLILRSPVDGVVGTLWHQPGDVAAAASPIVTVVDARPGMIVAILPEATATHVAVGAHATLRRERLFAHSIKGRVVELAPEVEEMPIRARSSPSIPSWGRRAFIQLQDARELVPGEAFRVSIR